MIFEAQNANFNSKFKNMDMKLVTLCVLVLSLELVCCQYSDSPCPGIFQFESDGANLYGKIVLQPVAPVHSLVLRMNFTVATRVYNNYPGRLEAQDSTSLLQKYNQGLPVSYRVYFPVTSPLPKLTALTVNDEILCYGPGDIPRPNSYVSTFSLQHTSFLQSGTRPVFNHNFRPQARPQPQPQYKPDPVLDLIENYAGNDGDTQIFTFNNIEPTWSSGNSPFYVINNSRPTTQSPQLVYQPPTQQVFQQPNRPVYDQNQYDQNNQNRPYDRPSRPVYEQATKRPVYQPPVERPSRPIPEDNYYQTERTTVPPRPVITVRPDNRQPDPPPSTSTECGIVAGGNERIPLIYNGNSYARGDLPWLVAIYKSEGGTLSFICGGTLVSNRHVVTAAHCMQRRSELTAIKDFVVKVGLHHLNDWSDDVITRTVISAAIHESYNSSTLENDILVFTFNKRVEFTTYIRPACLWNGNTDLSRIVGASGVVAGWGDQGTGGVGRQGEPHMVRVPIVSTAVCRASKPSFHQLTSQRTLCAGDRNGSGPCKGDSGGGLYLLEGGKWRIRGVVSVSLRAENGDNTCNLNEYIIFTDTAQYLTWIRGVISENYYD